MKNKVLNKTVHFLSKYQNYSDEDIEKLKYGLEGIYLTLTKMIIILILSIILKIWKEVIAILLLFNIIRYFGFGVHAGKSSECLISSIICFIVIPYIFINISLTEKEIILIGIISLIIFLLFAPADTIKRPLKNKKKRIIRKIVTIIITIIYILISICINNPTISLVLTTSVIIEAIMVNPLTYKLLNQPFNNYKNV